MDVAVYCVQIEKRGALIVAGFDDGVVRVLRLARTTKVDPYGRKEKSGPGFLTLVNALKPHSGRVTCLAIDRSCNLLASAVRSKLPYHTIPCSFNGKTWQNARSTIM